MQMTFQEAVRILREAGTECDSKGLYNQGHYTYWNAERDRQITVGGSQITLDSNFEVEELKAIVVFVETMRANPKALDELNADEERT